MFQLGSLIVASCRVQSVCQMQHWMVRLRSLFIWNSSKRSISLWTLLKIPVLLCFLHEQASYFDDGNRYILGPMPRPLKVCKFCKEDIVLGDSLRYELRLASSSLGS